MDNLQVQILIDQIAQHLLDNDYIADEIEDFLIDEADRVAQEIRDGRF